MSTSTPSQGTHFSDGVRVGPILGSIYTPGANVLTPSVMVSSPVDQSPPGCFDTPHSLLDLIPAASSSNAIAASQTPVAEGYLTLVTTNTINREVITYQGVQNVLKLDCARVLTINGGSDVAQCIFLVFGWDDYGVPMTEQLTLPANVSSASVVVGNKAFRYIESINVSRGTNAAITVGVGDAIGLPYYISEASYSGVSQWNSEPYTEIFTATLANNPFSTVSGSSIVTVALAGNNIGIIAANYVVGQTLQVSEGVPSVGGIVFNKLNTKVEINSIDYQANTISFDARMVATTTVAGGGAGITIQTNDKSVVGDQRTATATTRDVRGTYTPPSQCNGVARLMVDMYNASADARNYNAASNGNPKYLNNNPILTTINTSTVTVFAINHQLTGGENVTISGATAVGGIGAADINITAPITILDADTFTYVATANATSSAFGGGANINITPGIGNLYQSTVGRFGVTQYNLTPRP